MGTSRGGSRIIINQKIFGGRVRVIIVRLIILSTHLSTRNRGPMCGMRHNGNNKNSLTSRRLRSNTLSLHSAGPAVPINLAGAS
jgi:hypothetical protein